MFGLSLAEIAIILLVAIVVIGPKELPTVIRALARVFHQLRGLAHEFRRNFDELTEEAELKKISDDLTSMPTIIDLEGNEQRTYDISEEMEALDKKSKSGEKPDDA